MAGELSHRLARLAVGFGANVQPGQIVSVRADVAQDGHVELARAIAEVAYQHGARFVEIVYFDSAVKRLRIMHAPEETLEFVPPWYGEHIFSLGRERAARIAIAPYVQPGVLSQLDPTRAGKDRLPQLREVLQIIDARSVNWTVLPAPTTPWARQVYPDLEPDSALERLSETIVRACRLDDDDPVASWQRRMDALAGVAERLTERRFDALHFEGPGTDLTVGLLPTSRWTIARTSTVDGIPHMVNVPSEETFTAPDPERVEGIVRSTRPLDLTGVEIRGLVVRFERGRAVAIDAEQGADALRTHSAKDEGAARLGEVALVDRESRVGQLGLTFGETLLDENATSHLALGNAYKVSVGDDDYPRANKSGVHTDFMVGGEEVDVTGITREGARVPVLRGGAWAL